MWNVYFQFLSDAQKYLLLKLSVVWGVERGGVLGSVFGFCSIFCKFLDYVSTCLHATSKS